MDAKQFLTDKLKYTSEYAMNFDRRVIHVFGELNEEIGTNLRVKYDIMRQWWAHVRGEELKDITLDIASYGGSIYSIYATLDFYDELLRDDGVLVNTKAQGICMSAATILLAGGTGERTASKRSRIMLHDIQTENIGGTTKQVQSVVSQLGDEQLELFTMYAEFAQRGKDVKLEGKELTREAKKWMKRFTKDGLDHHITAAEALELRLIDRIL